MTIFDFTVNRICSPNANNQKLVYLASPYSHRDPKIRQLRYEWAREVVAKVLKNGGFIYSPIVYCHELAQKHDMPKGFDFWKRFDIRMIAACDELIVLEIDGWKESIGINKEIKIAQQFEKPVSYFCPSPK